MPEGVLTSFYSMGRISLLYGSVIVLTSFIEYLIPTENFVVLDWYYNLTMKLYLAGFNTTNTSF